MGEPRSTVAEQGSFTDTMGVVVSDIFWYSTSFFFFTLVTGLRRSLSLKQSDARVYEPQIRARLGIMRGLVSDIFW